MRAALHRDLGGNHALLEGLRKLGCLGITQIRRSQNHTQFQTEQQTAQSHLPGHDFCSSHQNFPNSSPLANSLKTQDPALFYNALTADWQPQLKPDDTKSWTRLQYKFSLIISAYEIYRALIEFIYRLNRSYHTYF